MKEEEKKRRKEEEETRRRGEEESQSTFENPQSAIGNRQSPHPSSLIPHPLSLLKAYQDGQLGWWERQRVRRHVANCAQCREEIQAMRDFSQFLQRGEGETLSPQLRARILAAVPDMVPATPIARSRRPLTRPVLAWGAVASALLLCIIVTPLFLKNDQTLRKVAATTAQARSADTTVTTNASVTGKLTESAKSDETRDAMKGFAPPVFAAAPSAPHQENAAPGMPGASADRPAPAAAPPSEKDITAADSANYAVKTAPEPQRNLPADKSVATGGSASLTNGNNYRASMPSSPPSIASAPLRIQADGQTEADVPKNNAKAAESKPSVAVAAPAKSVAVPSNPASSSMTPSLPAPQSKNTFSNARAFKKAVAHAAGKAKRRQLETGDILLLVGNVEQSRAALEQTVKSAGGTITGVKDITYGDSSQAAMLTLDVPTTQLPVLLSELDALGQREAFNNASGDGKTQFRITPPAPANSLNIMTNKTAKFEDTSGFVRQSQTAAQVPPRARANLNVNPTPAPAHTANAEPTTSANFSLPASTSRVTIHLQEKPRKGP